MSSRFAARLSFVCLMPLVLLAIWPAAARAQAQTPPPPPPQGNAKPQILGINDPKNPLHLTADQQRKYIAIIGKYRPKAMAIVQNSGLSQAQKQAEIAALEKSAQAELSTILSPAQRARVAADDQKRKARQAAMMQQLQGRMATLKKMNAQFMKTLTPAQKKKLSTLLATTKKQFAAIQASKSLTPQQKQSQEQALGKQYGASLSSLYTPAQKAMITKMRGIQSAPLAAAPAH